MLKFVNPMKKPIQDDVAGYLGPLSSGEKPNPKWGTPSRERGKGCHRHEGTGAGV